MSRLRRSEWVLVFYFFYVAAATLFYPVNPAGRSVAFLLPFLVIAAGLLFRNPSGEVVRDWTTLAFTLTAYREMDIFSRPFADHHLEAAWVPWDHWLLETLGGRALIEAPGPLLAGLLELCYLCTYIIVPVSLALLYANKKRERSDAFYLIWLLGTLGSYALFPYFHSDPPRRVFPLLDLPHVITPIRRFNLWILGGSGIHSSVFPSAHVSSAFAAAFALRRVLPERSWAGRGMLVYAALVTIATVYGRYHYAVDAIAGLGIAITAYTAARLIAPSTSLIPVYSEKQI